ncbi:AraC family transcriptional regulator [Acidaminobacter sp. JC074]|uniref:GyrI-like domain-containing protein n=1 Tax=Acidaminobacter sp. JC074 TaxID=2530199 RepID=UPI001F0ED78E|nr:GyrI-like domain-containing protein [Acidaminobacter sp. JC074]MCH4888420.1 AraC family transcriptional regulator [Acidaminobacter sp. JC074]
MNYRIETKPSMRLQGLSRRISTDSDCIQIPRFWDDFTKMHASKSITDHIGPLGLIGVRYNNCKVGLQFDYMIGVEANEAIEGIDSLEIPECTWAVFEVVGKLPESIQSVWQDILDDFFVRTLYVHKELPELEIYPDGDTSSSLYACEIWIPIED